MAEGSASVCELYIILRKPQERQTQWKPTGYQERYLESCSVLKNWVNQQSQKSHLRSRRSALARFARFASFTLKQRLRWRIMLKVYLKKILTFVKLCSLKLNAVDVRERALPVDTLWHDMSAAFMWLKVGITFKDNKADGRKRKKYITSNKNEQNNTQNRIRNP